MNILYDFQIFSLQKYGGISRYYYQLISCAGNHYEPKVVADYHINEILNEMHVSKPFLWNCKKSLGGKSFPGKGICCNIYNRITNYVDPWKHNQDKVISILNEKKTDVFHPTYYDDYFLSRIAKTPFVLTVHDMIHELFPELFFKDKTILLKKNLITAADHVIAVSNTTKKDILDFVDIPEKKVTVIYHASSFGKKSKYEDIPTLPKRYILFVGQRKGYKNFYFFLSAIDRFLKNDPELSVICAGKPFSIDEKKWMFEQDIPSDRILNFQVSDNELQALYIGAQFFVFPSLYEGFGIPVLEAFLSGCPVALSCKGSLPEIGGDAAVYFDPKSAIDIQHAMEQLLQNDELRGMLIRKGYERAAMFTWQQTLLQTSDVYKKVLS